MDDMFASCVVTILVLSFKSFVSAVGCRWTLQNAGGFAQSVQCTR